MKAAEILSFGYKYVYRGMGRWGSGAGISYALSIYIEKIP
jgi:hypothetical protein